MTFIDEALGWGEKITTLLSSRRLWLMVAEAALAIIAILAIVAPVLNIDIDTDNLPDDEALAERLMGQFKGLVALIGGIMIVLRELSSITLLKNSYHTRPPGWDKALDGPLPGEGVPKE